MVAAYNGMSAAIYRVGVDNASRQLVKTLQMNDPAGGFGITVSSLQPMANTSPQHVAAVVGTLPVAGTELSFSDSPHETKAPTKKSISLKSVVDAD